MKVFNWGKYPVADAEMVAFSSGDEARNAIADRTGWIARGMGRCYGDSALAPYIISTLSFNRFLSFDENTGELRCQSGVTIEEILKYFLPRGWFPPVTPGTKFITIGGAIASDVHGKNHHSEGSFSRHLLELVLLTPEGELLTCNRNENADVFLATCGGMGLTGLILEATFRLKRVETAYISQELTRAGNLDEAIALFNQSMHWTYSMAWIDCLAGGSKSGRSVLYVGEHATRGQLEKSWQKENPLSVPARRKLNVPFDLPGFVLNRFSIRLYNSLIYARAPKQTRKSIIPYETFFYPLDSILNWNRIYGKRGFTQYQCVLPPETSRDGLKELLRRISASGSGSFLAVLKWFGPQDTGISFPREGYTLALDFPVSPSVFKLLNTLDEVVLEAGGRLYLTKDARMSPEMFAQSYPHLKEFIELKKRLDPEGKASSAQWQRLMPA